MTNQDTLHDCDILIKNKKKYPCISVIVPVYNQSRTGFLVPCLDSLLAQTLKDIEIICIDDSSEDDSLNVLLGYAKKHPSFTVVKMKENSRQGTARNRGIDLARGKYIAFIDSDDMVSSNYFEQLYHVAEETHSEAVEASFQYIDENGNTFGSISKPHENKAHALNHASREHLILSHGMIWSYLFSSSLFKENDIRFPEKIRYEDTPTLIRLFFKINRIASCSKSVYSYRQSESSTMATTPSDPKAIKERLVTAKMILANSKEDGVYPSYQDVLDYYFLKVYLINTLYLISENDSDPETLNDIDFRQLSLYCKNHIPNVIRNPFIRQMSFRQRLSIIIAIRSPNLYLSLRKVISHIGRRRKSN